MRFKDSTIEAFRNKNKTFGRKELQTGFYQYKFFLPTANRKQVPNSIICFLETNGTPCDMKFGVHFSQ